MPPAKWNDMTMYPKRVTESPLLKLRQALEWAERSADGIAAPWPRGSAGSLAELRSAIAEAEERWELERELHKAQVRRIKKARHEYIMLLRTQLWLAAEIAYGGRRVTYIHEMMNP